MARGSRPVDDTIYQYMRSRFKHIARNSVKQVLAIYPRVPRKLVHV